MIIKGIVCLLFLIILIVIGCIIEACSNSKEAIDAYNKKEQKSMKEMPYSINEITDYLIILAGFSIFIFLVIRKMLVPSSNYGLLISELIYFILVDIYFIYLIIKNAKIHLLYKKAINMGKKTDGTITNYCFVGNKKEESSYGGSFYVVIKYNDINSGEEKILLTPRLSFNPLRNLGTDKCDVYFYKNTIIASGFKSYLETNTEHLNDLPKDNSYLRKKTTFEKIITIIGIIVAIIFAYFLFFTNQGILELF